MISKSRMVCLPAFPPLLRENQRLQISVSTTTARTKSPTNRIRRVAIRGASLRSGIGSLLSGRTLVMKICPQNLPLVSEPRRWSRQGPGKFKGLLNEAAALPPGGRRRPQVEAIGC